MKRFLGTLKWFLKQIERFCGILKSFLKRFQEPVEQLLKLWKNSGNFTIINYDSKNPKTILGNFRTIYKVIRTNQRTIDDFYYFQMIFRDFLMIF